MTKAEIVEHIYEKVGFSKKESAELVEKVFEIIKETLADGEKVKISGLRELRRPREERAQGPEPADRRGDPARGATRAHLQAEPRAEERPERRGAAGRSRACGAGER